MAWHSALAAGTAPSGFGHSVISWNSALYVHIPPSLSSRASHLPSNPSSKITLFLFPPHQYLSFYMIVLYTHPRAAFEPEEWTPPSQSLQHKPYYALKLRAQSLFHSVVCILFRRCDSLCYTWCCLFHIFSPAIFFLGLHVHI